MIFANAVILVAAFGIFFATLALGDARGSRNPTRSRGDDE